MINFLRRCLTVGVGIALSVALSDIAQACSCMPAPPPCQAIGQTELVFVGTVIDIPAVKPFKLARMRIDRVYKGKVQGEVELFDDGMCNGPDLQIGRQYLMYTHRLSSGNIPARGCTRSRAVEYADEDLHFLQQCVERKTVTQISGTVRFRPDEPDDSKLGSEGRRPMKDVKVVLSSRNRQFTRTTDASGSYAVSGLPPGSYHISAELSGYRTNWSPDEITLTTNGCAVADVLMKVDRRVHGAVRNAQGEPVPGVLVEMVPAHPNSKSWLNPILLDVSDEHGAYSIDGVPSGDYYLGINIQSTPTKQYPYPPVYYPNARDLREAIPIAFMTRASVQLFDLIAPERLPVIKVRGRIVDSSGAPAPNPEIRIKEPGLYGQIEQEPIAVDPEGYFEFDLCEGVRYSAFAFTGPIRESLYSAPVEFQPHRNDPPLLFVVNKSSSEFRELSKKLEQ